MSLYSIIIIIIRKLKVYGVNIDIPEGATEV